MKAESLENKMKTATTLLERLPAIPTYEWKVSEDGDYLIVRMTLTESGATLHEKRFRNNDKVILAAVEWSERLAMKARTLANKPDHHVISRGK